MALGIMKLIVTMKLNAIIYGQLKSILDDRNAISNPNMDKYSPPQPAHYRILWSQFNKCET